MVLVAADKGVVLRQIGAKIAYWRTLQGLTQAELGRKAHLSREVISKIERGSYNDNISISTIMDIAEAMSIDFTVLITFDRLERQMWDTTISVSD